MKRAWGLRRDRRGILPVIIVLAVVLLAIAGVVIAYSILTNPTRPMNDCHGNAVSYARVTGEYTLWQTLFGPVSGEFHNVGVQVTQVPTTASGANLQGASLFGNKGNAWVRMSVTGPGGVAVAGWDSTRTSFDFGLIDQAHAAGYSGSFVGGLACFEQHGISKWHYELLFEDDKLHLLRSLDQEVAV